VRAVKLKIFMADRKGCVFVAKNTPEFLD